MYKSTPHAKQGDLFNKLLRDRYHQDHRKVKQQQRLPGDLGSALPSEEPSVEWTVGEEVNVAWTIQV